MAVFLEEPVEVVQRALFVAHSQRLLATRPAKMVEDLVFEDTDQPRAHR